jgi:hypothetical protein
LDEIVIMTDLYLSVSMCRLMARRDSTRVYLDFVSLREVVPEEFQQFFGVNPSPRDHMLSQVFVSGRLRLRLGFETVAVIFAV